jgi:hypothetical protein
MRWNGIAMESFDDVPACVVPEHEHPTHFLNLLRSGQIFTSALEIHLSLLCVVLALRRPPPLMVTLFARSSSTPGGSGRRLKSATDHNTQLAAARRCDVHRSIATRYLPWLRDRPELNSIRRDNAACFTDSTATGRIL